MTNCTNCNINIVGPEALTQGIEVCTVCRTCDACGLVISKHEIDYCNQHSINPYRHARCLVLSHQPLPSLPIDHEVQLLNLARLLILPNNAKTELGNELEAEQATDSIIMIHQMKIEDIFIMMRKIQACAARCSVLIGKNSPEVKKELAAKAKKQFDEAALQALTSSRPASKKPDDLYEVELAEFMRINGITDRKHGIKQAKLRQNAIDSYVKLGMSINEARSMIDSSKGLRKNGRE